MGWMRNAAGGDRVAVPAFDAEIEVAALDAVDTVETVDIVEAVEAVDAEMVGAQEAPDTALRHLPVPAPARAVAPGSPAALPAVQAAAVAATGFVAGAATLALVRRHSARKQARRHRRRTADALPIVASRRFLVDVHLIAKPGE